MFESWWLRTAGQRELDFVWNLRRDLVISQGGDQADHSSRNLGRNRYEIGVAQRRQVGESVKPAAQPFDYAAVAHLVKPAGMNAGTQRGAGAKHPAAPVKGFGFLFEWH